MHGMRAPNKNIQPSTQSGASADAREGHQRHDQKSKGNHFDDRAWTIHAQQANNKLEAWKLHLEEHHHDIYTPSLAHISVVVGSLEGRER